MTREEIEKAYWRFVEGYDGCATIIDFALSCCARQAEQREKLREYGAALDYPLQNGETYENRCRYFAERCRANAPKEK